jgi:hypothetical protein
VRCTVLTCSCEPLPASIASCIRQQIPWSAMDREPVNPLGIRNPLSFSYILAYLLRCHVTTRLVPHHPYYGMAGSNTPTGTSRTSWRQRRRKHRTCVQFPRSIAVFYNFVKVHKSFVTPATQAGLNETRMGLRGACCDHRSEYAEAGATWSL